MMMQIETYIKSHDLYNYETLRKKCEAEGILIIESKKYPGLVMLHYNTHEVHFSNKWTEFNRRCRGLILDMVNKRVVAYPFDKFFNINEQPETQTDVLLELGSFEVSEKLDGSMIIVFKDPNTGKYVATTKGSFDSEHGVVASSIIPENIKNDDLHARYTLMFELIDKRFQIVVNYEKKGYSPGLYLIGARERLSGDLLPFRDVVSLAKELGVPTVRTYQFQTLSEVISKTKELPVLEEGYVIRFNKDGRLVKLKGDEYLYAHRFISKLSSKSILEALGQGLDKELIDTAPEEYRDDVIKEITTFKEKRDVIIEECKRSFVEAPKYSRKDYALWVNENVVPDIRGLVFKMFDGKLLEDRFVYKIIQKREGATSETHI